MKTAIIPGSFDPITNGHLDIIKRTAEVFPKVIVLVAQNAGKNYLLSENNRFLLVSNAVEGLTNVSVETYDGLLVDYISQYGGAVLIKGIRNYADFIYEENMANINRELSIREYGFVAETLLICSGGAYSSVSSSLVRTLLLNKRDCSDLVPDFELLKSFF